MTTARERPQYGGYPSKSGERLLEVNEQILEADLAYYQESTVCNRQLEMTRTTKQRRPNPTRRLSVPIGSGSNKNGRTTKKKQQTTGQWGRLPLAGPPG